ncbi:MAG: hypothetical protein AAGD10_08230 [Myxococcota bacterium]
MEPSESDVDERPSSRLALVGFWLSILIFIPGLPLLGALLGALGLVQIRRSGGQLGGSAFGYAAIGVGVIGGATALLTLATVVLPGALGFGDRARRGDAAKNLRAIERGILRFQARNRRLPPGDTGWTPSSPCCATGGRCLLDSEDWSTELWQALEFKPLSPPVVQLRYRRTSEETYEARARSDLDCDGAYEQLILRGGLTPTTGARSSPWVEVPEGEDQAWGLVER